MADLRPFWLMLGATGMALGTTSSPSRAADKTSLGCIQASDEGQTARDSGDLLHARELLAECAAIKCPPLIRRDCTLWLEDVQRQMPSVVLGAHDTAGHDVLEATVQVDGEPKRLDGTPLELAPGP